MRRYFQTSIVRYIGIALIIAGLSIPYAAAADAPNAQGLTEFGPGESVQPRTALATKTMTRTSMVASYNSPGFTP